MLYCSDMSVLHVIHGIERLKQNQHGAHGSPAPTLIVTSVSCHLVEMISPEMWLCVNGHFSGWLCVGSVSPVLTWVWFIIPSKPWVGQRPGEMEGTSTTGAFLTLVTVKRKGYTSKHFSRPRFFFIQHCITFFFFFHHTFRKRPQWHRRWWAGYSRLWWYTHWSFLVQICALRM